MIKRFLIFIVLCVFVAFLAIGYIYYLNLPVDYKSADKTLFIVSEGDYPDLIARKLYKRGLIRNSFFFKLLTVVNNSSTKMKRGGYLISPNMTTYQIYKKILNGSDEVVKVTILEGWTSSQISKILYDKQLIDKDKFLEILRDKDFIAQLGFNVDTLEGFLFPDTYFFSYGQSERDIIKTLINNFILRVSSLVSSDYVYSMEFYKKLILASIVEREYRLPEEAPLIASVFFNRLKKRIPLESCATIGYILTEEKGEKNRLQLTYDDLKIDSPFNTYRNYGLPPAPISNPGLTAIQAVLKPANTDYLYFVLMNPEEGKHYFSKTFEEHIRAKYLYLKPRNK